MYDRTQSGVAGDCVTDTFAVDRILLVGERQCDVSHGEARPRGSRHSKTGPWRHIGGRGRQSGRRRNGTGWSAWHPPLGA